MLTFQKYYCLDSIQNHARWIREMTDGHLESGQEILLQSDYTDCYFLLLLRFSVRFLQQRWKYRHLLLTLSLSLYYVLGTGFLFVPVCRGKAKWSLMVSLKLSNLIF